jgi:hypothetical protein
LVNDLDFRAVGYGKLAVQRQTRQEGLGAVNLGVSHGRRGEDRDVLRCRLRHNGSRPETD